jgi:hypothetical protein
MGVKIVKRGPKIGDAIARAVKPVARILGIPEDCEPCRRRQEKLNALGDRILGRRQSDET